MPSKQLHETRTSYLRRLRGARGADAGRRAVHGQVHDANHARVKPTSESRKRALGTGRAYENRATKRLGTSTMASRMVGAAIGGGLVTRFAATLYAAAVRSLPPSSIGTDAGTQGVRVSHRRQTSHGLV